MNITYIGFVSGHGGDAQQMLELAFGFAQRGHRVTVVIPETDRTQALTQLGKDRGVEIIRSKWIHADSSGPRQQVLNVVRLFARYRKSIVHIHSGDVCIPRSAQYALDLVRAGNCFCTLHSPYALAESEGWRGAQWAKAAPRIFHRIIVPSRHSREYQLAMGLPSEKVRTIYNAVDLERNRSGDATIAREALGIASDTPLVVFTSRLDHQKRPLDAVAAFRKVLYAVPDAHFAIVGRGDMEDQIRQRALEEGCSDRIHLVGFQSNVPDWLAAADAWYLPTESENFSLAVLEALAAGCPIASTPCQGNDEVLIHGENALLAPIGDIDAQARSIIQILENPDLRGRLALGAIETSHGYSSTRMLDEYEALYAECVGQ